MVSFENKTSYWEETTYDDVAFTTPSTPRSSGTVYPPTGVMKSMYIIIGSIGIADNLVVLAVFFTNHKLRQKNTCLFLINQGLIDFMASFTLLLTPFTKRQFYVSGFWGELLCRLWLSSHVFWCLIFTSTFNLCAVSIEKYFSIVHPIAHKLSFSRRKAIFAVVSVWLLGFLANVYIIGASGLVGDVCFSLWFWPTSYARRAIGIFNFVIKFFIPLSIFIFTYGWIFRVLKLRVDVAQQAGTENRTSTFDQSKRNSAKLLLTVVAGFVVCSAWNQIFFLALNLGAPLPIGTFYRFTVVMLFLNCCINPFIYIAKYKEFQVALRRFIGKLGIGTGIINQASEISSVGTSNTQSTLQSVG